MMMDRSKKYILLLTAVLLTVLFLRPQNAAAEQPERTPDTRIVYGMGSDTVIISMDTPAPSPTATPQPTPTQVPSPSPTPVPTQVPTPTPSPSPTPVRRLIALTFDDGPNHKYTPKVLDILARYDVKATFFLIGSQIGGCADVVRRMIDEGHEIGCHTWNHGSMRTQSEDTQRRGFEKWCAALAKALGAEYPVRLLRPPGGSTNSRAKRMAKEFGCSVILWSVDTRDWSNHSPTRIMRNVKKEVREGGIILMHDRIAATVEVLPMLIEYLIGEGYEFVTVSELLIRNGEAPEPGKVYRSVPAA